jgi:hypothetical protein
MGHGWGSYGETWKMGTWGWNIALETIHVLMGIGFGGSDCLGIEMRVTLLVETWQVLMGGKFRGSCSKACSFWLAEINTKPPPKHDMFLCQFALGPALPVRGNPCWAALKRVTHLQLVTEITLGINTKNNFKSQRIGKSRWFFHENQHSLRVLDTQNRPVRWFWFFEIPATVISWFCFLKYTEQVVLWEIKEPHNIGWELG